MYEHYAELPVTDVHTVTDRQSHYRYAYGNDSNEHSPMRLMSVCTKED